MIYRKYSTVMAQKMMTYSRTCTRNVIARHTFWGTQNVHQSGGELDTPFLGHYSEYRYQTWSILIVHVNKINKLIKTFRCSVTEFTTELKSLKPHYYCLQKKKTLFPIFFFKTRNPLEKIQ